MGASPQEQLRTKRQLTARAIDLAMAGRWDDASAVNCELLELFPEDVSSYNRLGKALIKLVMLEEAEAAYTLAAALDPTNVIATRNLQKLEGLVVGQVKGEQQRPQREIGSLLAWLLHRKAERVAQQAEKERAQRLREEEEQARWAEIESLRRRELAARRDRMRQLLEVARAVRPSDPTASNLPTSMAELLPTFSVEERNGYLAILPGWLLAEPSLFDMFRELRAEQQLAVVWVSMEDDEPTLWSRISVRLRLLCIFRAARDRYIPPTLRGAATNPEHEHPVVQFGLGVLLLPATALRPSDAFIALHDRLLDWVLSEAWHSITPIEVDPILPRCRIGEVTYCEGRPFPADEEGVSSVFCPRLYRVCDPGIARVYPDPELPLEEWSLLELLDVIGVSPTAQGVGDPAEYVPKLAGWINRLNEVRSHMECRVCRKVMVFNGRYAKNLARYNATVFSCRGGVGHDTDIYLSHCWACHKPIDSRDSRVHVEGYYLCLNCGSGPKHTDTFAQGDLCPKCGYPKMATIDRGSRSLRCRNQACRHVIKLPSDRHLTGQHRHVSPSRPWDLEDDLDTIPF